MFLERWLSWHASFRQSCRSVGGDQSTLLTPAAETRLTAGQRNRTVGAKRWVEPISPNRSLPSRVQFRHFPGLKTRNQSFEGDDQFSAVSVGSAALADLRQCPLPGCLVRQLTHGPQGAGQHDN